MKIQYCSDLHLEFEENQLYLENNQIKAEGDVLVLAGDITYWSNKHFENKFFDDISSKFKKVIYVAGNHEFFNGGDISILKGSYKANIRDNVIMAQNKSIVVEDVVFICTTLLSKIKPDLGFVVQAKMNDFRMIKYGCERFDYMKYNKLHTLQIKWLKKEIKKHKKLKKVVVTHHVPSNYCNSDKYRRSDINSAFVTELFDLIEGSSIDYWIYGHHHLNHQPVMINNTTLLTNQLGYAFSGSCKNYRNNAVFQI